ncbi:biotin--[acetyl-CoA-carboxylase] ligase [Kordiimonas sediminis]|uniref:biotin--[biotin carboxyl-carrier protein] ligase n=1 Tax=Kordiimonas sediminis TaxID=1735581 RepID=A0A919E8G6_9PROT|nr:biotin--[acetyl-CoA-carboxylase] ligase [Kordiimonas sediminis]GHF28622.1 biotin--[acetyl-CoA-carboxylase] ligase [Kordiimonas sediminis]
MPAGVGAFFIKETDSTNCLAASEAAAGRAGPDWFIAGHQTAGKGRRGNVWDGATGNLYSSLLWRPALKPADLSALPYITALAVRDTIVSFGVDSARVTCKWPNDLLLDEKKVTGILIESSVKQSGMLDYVIIGIGVNLTFHPETAFGATDLFEATGVMVSVADFHAKLAASMTDRINAWNVDDFATTAAEWSGCAWGLGERREFRLSDRTEVGTLIGLADDGGLKVQLDEGAEIRLYAGDVFPVTEK